MIASRLYLAGETSLAQLERGNYLSYQKEQFTETFLDTPGSSLSNAECILKCDSMAPRFWKLFCFAENNIMEITTDEQDIREPLSRLSHFHSPDLITKELLQPFFTINNVVQVYLVGDCAVEVLKTDYGFAFCRISHFFNYDCSAALGSIGDLSKHFGLRNLALYEPLDYILEKPRKA